MSDTSPPTSFWIIAVVGLIWSVMGCINYVSQTSAEAITNLPEAYQLVVNSRPAFVTGAFMAAVFGGAFGCVLMLMRRAVARPVFLVSLIGVVITMVHALWVIGSAPGAMSIVMGTGMSVIVAGFLVWYTHRKEGRGWLR
ncbi:MAG: hypothetical protein ACPGRD_02820 [Planktomarina sp.]